MDISIASVVLTSTPSDWCVCGLVTISSYVYRLVRLLVAVSVGRCVCRLCLSVAELRSEKRREEEEGGEKRRKGEKRRQ